MSAPACSECGRPLLLSNSALMCCWRHCPAYGQDVSEDNPAQTTITQQTPSDKVAHR